MFYDNSPPLSPKVREPLLLLPLSLVIQLAYTGNPNHAGPLIHEKVINVTKEKQCNSSFSFHFHPLKNLFFFFIS
ncbi:hypothetical protein F4818DRAFT_418489, partial [Hypoxylon cercidicola]